MEGSRISGADHVYQHAIGPSPHATADGGGPRMATEQAIKLCECGCGQPTKPAQQGDSKRGYARGEFQRFVKNHHNKKAQPEDVWERIKRRSVWTGDCLVWTGDTVLGGYGRIRVTLGPYQQRNIMVHRAAYEYFKGPIPEGMTIDHVWARGCRFRACCNPDHLEAVTFRDNVLRGSSFTAVFAKKTHCPSGHPYDDVNTRWYEGRRYCRACHLAHGRERRRRDRERRQSQ